jgi:hypothetical protein
VWPRDPRGRLQVDGDRLNVFLPGMKCTGALSDLALECMDGTLPWPLGIENTGLEPARNYFATPEGLQFYSAAPLRASAEARWLVADRTGALRLLDSSRRSVTVVGRAEDVSPVAAPCDQDSYVLAAGRADDRQTVQLFRVAGQRLVSVGSAVVLSGRLTALWTAPAETRAVAVIHDVSSNRYEAFLATVSCGG